MKIGAQLFINRHDTPDEVRDWVDRMHRSELSLIRLFMQWDYLERRPGAYDWSRFDACFERAADHGMGVVPTIMANSPPGWMHVSDGAQSTADIDDPELWGRALEHVAVLVRHYRDFAALHSWILWNEPQRWIKPSEHSLYAFRKYLSGYCGDIEGLNRRYFQQYGTFDDVGTYGDMNSIEQGGLRGYTETLDWLRFSEANLNEKLADIAAVVRREDGRHPLHINPAGLAESAPRSGKSVWTNPKGLDFVGCSAHPVWHSRRFPNDRIHQSIGFFADLTRSATPSEEGRFWVSELQGGPNTFSAPVCLCPTGTDIEHWLWEGVGAGAEATVFWCFNWRKDGREGGEWALVNQLKEPSDRLEAATRTVRRIEALRDRFQGSRPVDNEVYLLFSQASRNLRSVEGKSGDKWTARNQEMSADAVIGAYLLFSDLGYSIGFVDEPTLQAEGIPDGRILVIPGCGGLEEGTLKKAFELASEHGVHVIADELCGYKDEDGQLSDANAASHEKLFGCRLKDTLLLPERDSRATLGGGLPSWFVKVELHPTSAETLVAEDGKVFLTAFDHQGARAIRIGTVFFQQYLPFADDCHRDFIRTILPARKQGIVLANPDHQLRLRLLKNSTGTTGVLLNRGDKRVATVTAPLGGVRDLESGEAFQTNDGHVEVPVDGESVRFLSFDQQS